MGAAGFFRAIDLRADLGVPERLGHYHPTTRSAPVIEAILGSDATIVIAAYGSGKSLAAGVGALAVRNDANARQALKTVVPRLRETSTPLHARIRERLRSPSRGKVVILNGYVADLAGEIARGLGLSRQASGLDRLLKRIAEEVWGDHIAIVWDEFGRHLEGLVSEGRTRDLDQVQRLSEWSVRSRNPTCSLTLLLHQNLLAYAGSLNQTSRNEWRKIEGRFRQIRFVEDSKELYSLVASAITDCKLREVPAPSEKSIRVTAAAAAAAGWFDGPRTAAEVSELLISTES